MFKVRSLAIFLFGIVAGVLLSAVALSAQHRPTWTMTTDTNGQPIQVLAPASKLVRGSDLAIRIVSTGKGRVVGTLMANVDGKWTEVQFAPQDTLATAH